ncbi:MULTISPECIES: acetyl-CoA hydrolase/transferase C-terminal domain-containing protein [unclassified Rhizobium]|uniref:acetyl-CoA hydrolase/transferase family protein n=1 Tax=unclassified Rhizobium TaxID=2613769 RepID=UPI000DE13BCA|nr:MULTISPECIES: acetyl-CoA hydrolase/transferase C-terminal domain-containing protein [unclassified Rhizobium]MBB3289209.1 itaconate CoA-transferase [Rhizobium sp. BK252]MBB3403951.1 itaconate CoA-transferase [Rhizobium sp. BK289]MBB3416380.1 itaconate CoA-transferase [Rhizobium sp. BK284]MBB3484414.1 itaconate CoA-transferase [Rhizobium sp. BK347]
MTGTHQMLYRERLRSAKEAVDLIPSVAKVAMPIAAGQPPAILAALAERARAGAIDNLRLHYLLCTGVAGTSVFDFDLCDQIIPISYFHGGVERALDKRRSAEALPAVDLVPCHFSQVPRSLVEHVGVDTLIATVAPMDADGNFSLGVSTDYALTVSRKPGIRLILEVNANMPYVRGDCMIPISSVTALVENDVSLPILPAAPSNEVDDTIGAIVAGLVEDGDCLQMGIGALPDAVCSRLLHHRHLGIHTEMMTVGLADLLKAGVVDNSRKQTHVGRSIFTFALGDQSLYDLLHDNPDIEAHPVDYVNNPFVISQNDRAVSVNATLQVDLNGACNSEFVNGRQFSASGGQVDFVRGAYASRGGRSIIACHSTAAKGTLSRIVPALTGPVTTSRNDTHIIVTEYGWANLKGKSVAERAKALIALAHPDFREELDRAAHGAGLYA